MYRRKENSTKTPPYFPIFLQYCHIFATNLQNVVSGCVNVCRLLGTACPFASGFMGCSDIPSVDSVLPSEDESLLFPTGSRCVTHAAKELA